ncbi:hypothetical protein CDAR_240811 [Caerostris darwini]|uniref:Uncharacterized protein n=1 Tax=Caerostris darwini TaxID=1538125 RepID=A0AAV4UA85_9ARAC|nr:hypothetical protein CDAR_240811 [Caerostris darwini]
MTGDVARFEVRVASRRFSPRDCGCHGNSLFPLVNSATGTMRSQHTVCLCLGVGNMASVTMVTAKTQNHNISVILHTRPRNEPKF